MDYTDKEYVQRCRDGHPEDFRMLVCRYQGPLMGYLKARLGDWSEVEEAAQESFVRAFQSLRKLRKPESFYPWLMGIAGRVIQEHFRFLKHRQRNREIALSLPERADNYERENRTDCFLDEALANLPDTYRRVILLRYYDGLSCNQVAQRLEIPLGTVTKTLSRAYTLLRQEIKARENT
jgi:RNA polymerase sigma-70 factor (ECF subfamily)